MIPGRASHLVVLQALRGRGALTRGELQRVTRLSHNTVQHTVGALLERGLVTERAQAKDQQTIGRPAARLAAARRLGAVASLELATNHVAAALGDFGHVVVATQRAQMEKR